MSRQWMRAATRRTTIHGARTTAGEDEVPPQASDPLSAEHRRILAVGSGIAPKVIEARGYRTLTRKVDARALGFSDYQCRMPALLVPVFTLSGEIATYQLRPDIPRIKQGKVIKYETPSGSTMALDVSPLIRDQVRDVRVPLLITEGIKKADAAISRGGCCIALLGVWNWRGKDAQGGKRLLADFERIPLNDREVFIVFDSDLLEKDEVALALVRLGRVLAHSFRASVRVVRLPSLSQAADVSEGGPR